MPDDLLSQLVLQAPTIAALLYLLIRLDARLDELIETICELATEDRTGRMVATPVEPDSTQRQH